MMLQVENSTFNGSVYWN